LLQVEEDSERRREKEQEEQQRKVKPDNFKAYLLSKAGEGEVVTDI